MHIEDNICITTMKNMKYPRNVIIIVYFAKYFTLDDLSDSEILTKEPRQFYAHLTKWLPIVTGNWTVCWRASEHGWGGRIFHSRCDDEKPTLTIVKVVKDGKNFIFGGFATASFKGKMCFKYSLQGAINRILKYRRYTLVWYFLLSTTAISLLSMYCPCIHLPNRKIFKIRLKVSIFLFHNILSLCLSQKHQKAHLGLLVYLHVHLRPCHYYCN